MEGVAGGWTCHLLFGVGLALHWDGSKPFFGVCRLVCRVDDRITLALRTSRMGWFTSFFQVIWSGIHPGPNDSHAWYDRLIRVVGGLFIYAVMLWVLLRAASR